MMPSTMYRIMHAHNEVVKEGLARLCTLPGSSLNLLLHNRTSVVLALLPLGAVRLVDAAGGRACGAADRVGGPAL